MDDDFFDDADLNELERNAIASTQAPALSGGPPSNYDLDDEDDDDVHNGEAVIDLDAPHVPPFSQQSSQHFRAHAPGEIRVQEVDEKRAREEWRSRRFAQTTPGVNRAQGFGASREVAPQQPLQGSNTTKVPYRSSPIDKRDLHLPEHPPQVPDDDVAELRARVQELEFERFRLQRAAEEAQNAAMSKAGEIAIVRSNHDKAFREHDKRVAAMQKQHSEELARQKAELEGARRDREKLETDKKFLEHDLAQEAQRTRRSAAAAAAAATNFRTLKDGSGGARRRPESPLKTPRKDRSLALRDGFEDDEVMVVSPSKAPARSKPVTPSKLGDKRKRDREEQNSPLRPLELDQDSSMQGFDDVNTSGSPSYDLPIRAHPAAAEEANFIFTQRLLNHRTERGRVRTVEALTRAAFPSSPRTSIASLIYDHLGSSTTDPNDFKFASCGVLATLWTRCLDEFYYAPIGGLVRLLQDVIMADDDPDALFNSLTSTVLPLCQRTVDLVALPNAKSYSSVGGQQQQQQQQQQRAPGAQDAASHIDPYDYLQLMMLMVLSVDGSAASRTDCWRHVECDFVLLMLHRSQPVAQITLVLQLLETCFLQHCFPALAGPSTDDDATVVERRGRTGAGAAARQTSEQRYLPAIVDRLTVMLFETPIPPADEPDYSPEELLTLRRHNLSVLRGMCASGPYGAAAVADHRFAVGRLVRFLHDAVVSMYRHRPATHALTVSLVNQTVLLLAHLTSPSATAGAAPPLDMRAKLAAEAGGPQKHLVSLSRIAFSEGATALEAGILAEVAEQAHRMLDEHLSPEEGEAVVEVFSSVAAAATAAGGKG